MPKPKAYLTPEMQAQLDLIATASSQPVNEADPGFQIGLERFRQWGVNGPAGARA